MQSIRRNIVIERVEWGSQSVSQSARQLTVNSRAPSLRRAPIQKFPRKTHWQQNRQTEQRYYQYLRHRGKRKRENLSSRYPCNCIPKHPAFCFFNGTLLIPSIGQSHCHFSHFMTTCSSCGEERLSYLCCLQQTMFAVPLPPRNDKQQYRQQPHGSNRNCLQYRHLIF